VDFHKVSESEDAEVFQSMDRLETKEMETDDGRKLPAPRKYGPTLPAKIDEKTLAEIFDVFSGYDIDSIAISKGAGIVVRVNRDKNNPYVEREADVERLESRKKGGN
jgi:hypothetical protein